ncbi:hypothetical protein N7456_012341 [Penicillium angulare]|uniref:ubiquitinyl hydrolase 1 n=1 Tax=Penicillium angulare TaxID=116970 RepID=A0A9W9K0X7_9EURO|nr:hypothetical protein N7456_012341 [Penicillium angulare]
MNATINSTNTVCPKVTTWSILAILAAPQWNELPDKWRKAIVGFGTVISALRRCERLIANVDADNKEAFFKEAKHLGCDGWNPLQYPVWLLLEIENDITIRKHQAGVAFRIITSENASNIVLQLNMGEGKTSVIMPMVASVLADGLNLCRVIVLKPLLRQSMSLLTHRLGCLIGRCIYHLPFSRNTPIDTMRIGKYTAIFQECLNSRGLLIALPEHILSFRLVGLDSVERTPDSSLPLINLEKWLQKYCRDVLDESDEILDPKFQLVYTMGTQQGLDGDTHRWEVVQSLLQLVAKEAILLQQEDDKCIELGYQGYRYPILTFLKPSAIETLTQRLLKAISLNKLPGLPFAQWNSKLRGSIMDFIQEPEPSDADVSNVQGTFAGTTFRPKLLLLRGLFACGILKFTLTGKRWLVDYGLHVSRCVMAVPYRAKGVPSENAEFGHPDVAIILTCLSYYYEGLTFQQISDCFTLLAKDNDPASAFQTWIEDCAMDLPNGMRALSGINIEDQAFKSKVFPILRYQKDVLDFYLTNFVFAKGAKEFPRKLSTSAWDLPSRSSLRPTTGFSGTNDNRFLLPRNIQQKDLRHLHHTNALVLSHLLQQENRKCVIAEGPSGRQLETGQLLDLVLSQCKARVLIDVGAHIIESHNRSVAELWLSRAPVEDGILAAIFFNDEDEVIVVDRIGRLEPLASSSFKQRMESCLIFLDQHHSRGVDLKFAVGTRAAITLGPRLMKDKLVQACNRLRGLGTCHSVTFVITPEVKHSMTTLLGSPANGVFDSSDVLKWSMIQTCLVLDSLQPLWGHQGLEYYRRIELWDSLISQDRPCRDTVLRIQEPEARTLEQLYVPKTVTEHHMAYDTENSKVKELVELIKAMGEKASQESYLHEEQEREVACEVEREQQVHRPPSYSAQKCTLHEDVVHFVRYGTFRDGKPSTAFKRAFSTLQATSVRKTTFPHDLGARLFVTADYDKTVILPSGGTMDQFMKPVHWILSSVHTDDLIILSQFEASQVLASVKVSKNATLHVYAPRLTKTMQSFRNLDFFSVGAQCAKPIPHEQARDFELFAGSLYFSSFEEYKDFQFFLGLPTDCLEDIAESDISRDGYVSESARVAMGWPACPFSVNPLPFLRTLIYIRMKGQGCKQTHMGSIIETNLLTSEAFERSQNP